MKAKRAAMTKKIEAVVSKRRKRNEAKRIGEMKYHGEMYRHRRRGVMKMK